MTDPGEPTRPGGPAGGLAACVRHPDRPTGLSCTRCGRPACVDCLREASVGYQCVDCVAESGRTVRRGTTIAGARPIAKPVVVPILIALNAAVFLLTVVQARSLNGNDGSDLFGRWSLVPGLVANGEWWRVVTAGFLHFGPLHLLFNMLALWVIGRDIELILGRTRFITVYLVSLLGGSAAALVFYGSRAEVAGASGAVFGLMGGLVVLMRRMRAPMSQIIMLIAVNIAISIVLPGVSLIGHLGGLVVGAIATAIMVYAPARNRIPIQVGATALLTAILVVVTIFAA